MAHGKSGLQVLKRDQRTTKTVKSQQQSNDHRPQTRHLDEMRFDSFHACQTATKIASACAHHRKSKTGLLATVYYQLPNNICLHAVVLASSNHADIQPQNYIKHYKYYSDV